MKEEISQEASDVYEERERREREDAVRGTVRALEDPITRMVVAVLERIKNGDYQLLIGEDASGRIPTHIVRDIVNAYNRSHGRGEVPTRFIAGTRGYDQYLARFTKKKVEVGAFIQKLKREIPDLRRALVVTDTITSGASLRPIAESLEEAGISHDILTIASSGRVKGNMQASIFSGGSTTPSVYNKWLLSGVEKDPTELHAKSVTRDERVFDPADPSESAEQRVLLARDMEWARNEAHLVARRIIEERLPEAKELEERLRTHLGK